eukprot:scaffold2182_cov118-Isochrysis_galbana.AAC.2
MPNEPEAPCASSAIAAAALACLAECGAAVGAADVGKSSVAPTGAVGLAWPRQPAPWPSICRVTAGRAFPAPCAAEGRLTRGAGLGASTSGSPVRLALLRDAPPGGRDDFSERCVRGGDETGLLSARTLVVGGARANARRSSVQGERGATERPHGSPALPGRSPIRAAAEERAVPSVAHTAPARSRDCRPCRRRTSSMCDIWRPRAAVMPEVVREKVGEASECSTVRATKRLGAAAVADGETGSGIIGGPSLRGASFSNASFVASLASRRGRDGASTGSERVAANSRAGHEFSHESSLRPSVMRNTSPADLSVLLDATGLRDVTAVAVTQGGVGAASRLLQAQAMGDSTAQLWASSSCRLKFRCRSSADAGSIRS